jgi:hypothetical protein
MKIKEKKKGISISINAELLKKVKKKIFNISKYIEELIRKDLP